MANSRRARRGVWVNSRSVEALEHRVLLSTIVVNTTIDGLFPPSTGIVSLRNAVATANSSSTSTTITFDPQVFGADKTILLGGTGLSLTGNQPITIVGPAFPLTIDGNRLGAVVQITAGSVSISGLTIRNGSAGGISNSATLALQNSTVTANTGGGISNTGSATLTGVTISNNVNSGYQIIGSGGLYNAPHATVSLDHVTISGNVFSGDYGGAGICNFNGAACTLHDVTVSGNQAKSTGWGGGIFNLGPATLVNVAVTGNSCGGAQYGAGGGIDNGGGTMSLANVTVFGNSAPGYAGGGINNGGFGTPTLTVTNCTIYGNTADSGGGIANDAGCTVTISNSIVARDTPTQGVPSNGPDLSGSFNSLGYNIVGETDGSTGWNNYDLTGTVSKPLDPELSPLGNYGGFSQTMALLPGSPALNAGWSALSVDASDKPLTTDQRGLPRVYGASVDIGAYESQPPALAGDVNHDGTVNLSDLLLLTRDFGKSTPVYESGDLNGDGTVSLADFLLVAQNFGKAASYASVTPTMASSVLGPDSGALTRRRLATRLVR